MKGNSENKVEKGGHKQLFLADASVAMPFFVTLL